MAPTIATAPGFIIPNGDSFPSSILHSHSPVAPPNNVESDADHSLTASALGDSTAGGSVVTSSAFTSPTTSETVSASTESQGTVGTSETLPPAAIVGILLAVLAIIVIIFFVVRAHFIRQRASKVTPARARASQIVISGPTNFQHVSTADGTTSLYHVNDKVSMNVGTARVERWTPHGQPDLRVQTDLSKDEKPWVANESPFKQKYSLNFGKLESGLHDHVQTMQFARNHRQDSF